MDMETKARLVSGDTSVIDERSKQLIKEFAEHWSYFQREEVKISKGDVFEGWALQKIAGLQLMVELLMDEVRGSS